MKRALLLLIFILCTLPLNGQTNTQGGGGAGNVGNAHNISTVLVCAAASGSGTTYTCSTAPTFVPADGDVILFQADVASTGAMTLNVNASGAAPVKKQGGGTAIAANDFLAGQDSLLEFDGTNWQMQGQIGNGLSLPGTVVQTNQTNVYGAFLQDFSAGTFEFPEAAGFTSTADSTAGNDTTNNNIHLWVNSADSIAVAEAAALAANTIPKQTDATHGLLAASLATDNGTTFTYTGTGGVSAPILVSTVAIGTPPFTVTSTTNVPNLNASIVPWSGLSAPASNLTLAHGSNSTTFNWGATAGSTQWQWSTTGAPSLQLLNPTSVAAVQNSPTYSLCGAFQATGGPTFAADCWNLFVTEGAGTNGASTLNIAKTGGGSTGTATVLMSGNQTFGAAGAQLLWTGRAILTATGAAILKLSDSGGAGAMFQTGSVMSNGTTFTASGCTNSTLVGGATKGSYVSGTTGVCAVTVTMGNSQTATHGWACSVSDVTTPADTQSQTGAASTTTASFTGTTVSGDRIVFSCDGY
jgi:hypothetical protein